MEKKKYARAYRIIRAMVKLCYPEITFRGLENLPEEPVILVGNHCQMNGPITAELYAPGKHYTWCASEMMTLSEVPDYAYRDFWCRKSRATRWFYRGLSYAIAPLSVIIFNNACTIPVYRDMRLMSTFRETMQRLGEGANIVIFPEKAVPNNHILYKFQDHFVDVARMYHRKTGRAVCFVPMYIAPKLKTAVLGAPVRFDPQNSIEAERSRICDAMTRSITSLAEALPSHRVVPYLNIGRRNYPMNKPEEKRAS